MVSEEFNSQTYKDAFNKGINDYFVSTSTQAEQIIKRSKSLHRQKLNNAEITIFEKEKDICLHQSGRNSGVIHSGIYYKPGSKKAINCIEGYKEILHFCNNYKIPFELCGKLIVGNNHEDLEKLKKIKSNGEKNGLNGLKIIEQQK